jgi:uncharacterized protein YyaL (SSP411 family)
MSKAQQLPSAKPRQATNNYAPTLRWLCDSIETHGGKGSAAFYSRLRYPLRGWAPPYPETTGYVIETLLDYYDLEGAEKLKKLAVSCADWLCEVQRPDGSYPALYASNPKPSVFNTGQILFGLTRAFEVTADEKYFSAAVRSLNWLTGQLHADGCWTSGAYVPGFSPSYYSRVIWAMRVANRVVQNLTATNAADRALDFYEKRFLENGAVRDWGFRPNQPAFTHTIAYTLRGFLETATLTQNQALMEKVRLSANVIAESFERKGQLAGSYDEHWRGDFSFVCVTGNCQLSVFFARLFEATGEVHYLKTAAAIFDATKIFQCRLPIEGWYGAIPGSKPFWGKYMPFRYPNWAAKFYLDAWLNLWRLNSHLPKGSF